MCKRLWIRYCFDSGSKSLSKASIAHASLLLGKNRVPEECIFTCPHFLKSLLIVSRPVHVCHCFPTLALSSLPQWPLQSPSGPKTCCSNMDGFIVVIFIGLKHNLTNHGIFGVSMVFSSFFSLGAGNMAPEVHEEYQYKGSKEPRRTIRLLKSPWLRHLGCDTRGWGSKSSMRPVS